MRRSEFLSAWGVRVLVALLQDSASAVDLVRKVGRDSVKFLYDRYLAILNDEPLGWAVSSNIDLIGHIQAADIPGRHKFGASEHDWKTELGWLINSGYNGYVGIEAQPIGHSSLLCSGAQDLLRSASV